MYLRFGLSNLLISIDIIDNDIKNNILLLFLRYISEKSTSAICTTPRVSDASGYRPLRLRPRRRMSVLRVPQHDKARAAGNAQIQLAL